MANTEQLALLKKCSEACNCREWNEWVATAQEKNHDFRPDLIEADLNGAHLYRAGLGGANLTGAQFDGADLSEALLGATTFADVDLSEVKGLEAVKHEGPSTIGIDTLYKSKGNIPEAFLRGCGVPETMIAFAKSLVSQPIQFYSAFISYSSKDQEFAERLHADLQAKHVRVWFAPEDLKIGNPLHETIDQAIRVYDKLMIVLSERSINSAWCKHEVTGGLKKEERENRLVLFPIRLDDTVFDCTEQWAFDIHKRNIGDFTHWKDHDSYQKAFTRLLRDLQAEQPKPASSADASGSSNP